MTLVKKSNVFPLWGLALLQTSALAWVGAPPAGATIVLAGATPEATARHKALAHEEGKQLKAVVGLRIQKDTWPAKLAVGATGVYLGPAKDGRTGLVLTSAHQWFYEAVPGKAGQLDIVVITFGPKNTAALAAGSSIAFARRVVIHPDHRKAAAASASYSASSKPGAAELARTDLALVEFELNPMLLRSLEEQGVQPALIYNGTGYKKPLLEGQIAGFGALGTHQSPVLENQAEKKIHAGNTRVSHCVLQGKAGFHHWSPHAAAGLALLEQGGPDASLNSDQYSLALAAQTYLDPVNQLVIQVQSHKKQALFAEGDSGSPLFLNTSKGLTVAGIASYSCSHFLYCPATGKGVPFIRQMWEPLKENLPWIEAVRDGDRAGSLVMEVKN